MFAMYSRIFLLFKIFAINHRKYAQLLIHNVLHTNAKNTINSHIGTMRVADSIELNVHDDKSVNRCSAHRKCSIKINDA